MTIKTGKWQKDWSLLDLAGRVASGIDKDHCVGHAAEIAFFFLFALFPCLLSLTSLLAYLPVPDLVQGLLRIMDNFLPNTVLSLVEKNLQSLVTVQGRASHLWRLLSALVRIKSGDRLSDRPE